MRSIRSEFRITPALAVLFLTGHVCSATPSPLVSIAGQHVTLAGTVKRVETGPQAALFTSDAGQDYVLDLSQAKITLLTGNNANGVFKLKPGMRGTVSGLGNSDGSIAVSFFRVLIPPPVPVVVSSALEPPDMTVRGTVEAIDQEQGAFVLRINTHTRTVFVTADTDVSALGPSAAARFPIQPGQRVTVGGALQPNGTLLAGLLTTKEDIDYRTPASQPNRVLLGTVSSVAGRLQGRDMKIRVADGTETKIQVPHDIPIRRLGRPISVHDLTIRDTVRVTGRLIGTQFQAARIDVLAPLGADALGGGSPPPPRPGL